MAPPPKPTHLKLITGNPGKRRLTPDDIHAAVTLPPPPRHLCAEAKEEWARVSQELFALRILSNIDIAILGAYCSSYALWVQATDLLNGVAATSKSKGLLTETSNKNIIQSPLIGIMNKAASDMARYAAEFGMSPSSRSRITGDLEQAPRKFDGLIGGRKT